MARTITLKYAGRCADCGAELEVGTRARWYGRGRVYGLDCHGKGPGARSTGKSYRSRMRGYRHNEPLGLTRSRFDDHGVYSADGAKIGSTCGCEDYPCCGH